MPIDHQLGIHVETLGQITLITLTGQLDSSTALISEEQILPLVHAQSRILLDMAGVTYMSSAGLRILLLLHRHITEQDGQVILVGLSEAIRDTMAMTGFLEFFTVSQNRDEALRSLQGN